MRGRATWHELNSVYTFGDVMRLNATLDFEDALEELQRVIAEERTPP
jgi:hypothetical protein